VAVRLAACALIARRFEGRAELQDRADFEARSAPGGGGERGALVRLEARLGLASPEDHLRAAAHRAAWRRSRSARLRAAGLAPRGRPGTGLVAEILALRRRYCALATEWAGGPRTRAQVARASDRATRCAERLAEICRTAPWGLSEYGRLRITESRGRRQLLIDRRIVAQIDFGALEWTDGEAPSDRVTIYSPKSAESAYRERREANLAAEARRQAVRDSALASLRAGRTLAACAHPETEGYTLGGYVYAGDGTASLRGVVRALGLPVEIDRDAQGHGYAVRASLAPRLPARERRPGRLAYEWAAG
jgi:hypothetical protein